MYAREMKKEDLPRLREIFLKVRTAAFAWDKTETYKLEDFDKQTIDEEVLLIEEEGEILGFVSIYVPDSFIHHLFVDTTKSRKGIGSQLIAEALNRIELPATLKCVTENEKALAFYAKEGWVKTIQEKDDGISYWVMKYTN